MNQPQTQEIMAPAGTGRPGIIGVNFSRGQMLRLLELLKDTKGDDRVMRNIIMTTLKLTLSVDIEALGEDNPRSQKYKELLRQLEEEGY